LLPADNKHAEQEPLKAETPTGEPASDGQDGSLLSADNKSDAEVGTARPTAGAGRQQASGPTPASARGGQDLQRGCRLG
jgi:hypothetical protein